MTVISWQFGTAYDFFISLYVLTQPERFGLRPSWAAGVRSRLPIPHRKLLEDALEVFPLPLGWLNQQDWQPKDATTALTVLAALPAADRLSALLQDSSSNSIANETAHRIQHSHAFTNEDLDGLRGFFQKRVLPVKNKTLLYLAQSLAQADQFGDQFLEACQVYFDVFFAEEEKRILPFLQSGISAGQQMAERLAMADLFHTLSRGISYESFEEVARLILIPSYWCSPLVFLHTSQPGELGLVYGCRSEDQNLVPGQYIPEALIASLKALSDSTRLRIAHYLKQSPQTPSNLARLLRLRAPTVIHHLNILRLAGLVEISISANGERCYTMGADSVVKTIQQLEEYLNQPENC